MIYFQMLDNFVGEVYFRVSKHLSITISEVIRRFYNYDWDIKMLMRKYGEEIKNEQLQAEKLEKQAKKAKLNRRFRR